MRGHFYIICRAPGPAKVLRGQSKYEHQQDVRGRLTISGSGDSYISSGGKSSQTCTNLNKYISLFLGKWVVGGAHKKFQMSSLYTFIFLPVILYDLK